MVTAQEDSDITSEENKEEDFLIHNTQRAPRATSALQLEHLPMSKQTNQSLQQMPARTTDIRNLLKEMKALFAVDIALVREDLGAKAA
ncbi:Hypothetical predicted protein [Pelobates cultripes]|uniref:Uncharacterized protein n=1 Tax=Pelobates cultripes TaxID=61616 RepID=A0AAD1RZK1_PELCU|nr:Hypothetical predicted protein [Pelobates cultripes]